ncbi:extracellular solute-binding protein, family 3 [Andreprevotia lacus DSM 23236]|jgi:ABC-type amino acid transport substrate-binding protein|uniref:Extracellular solute-binding protein, family 3 n=1 Tax=Andreprevotia lacus DSM 23236 TaxID=1121001 RepID=A0A1W1XZB5_9NEIS|nr:transporter substrate-binding domain-containing protein [Andreprevotia lacus]SMC29310.1 extracellular solute-binding protein, family 3 [Andreprevotia lacus DSM 23236]
MRGFYIAACLLAAQAAVAAPLRICAEDQWPPFAFVQDGKPAGASIDLVLAAFKAVGVPVNVESGSYVRCMQLVREGRFDALIDVAQNDERRPQLLWPRQPMLLLELHLVGNKPRGNDSAGFERMQSRRVGITRGYEYPNRMLTQPGIQLVESPSELGNFRHLALGDLDFMLLSRGTLATLLSQLTVSERQHIHDWGAIDTLPLYLAFGPGKPEHQQAADAFDRGMQQLRKSGDDQRILDKWKAVP